MASKDDITHLELWDSILICMRHAPEFDCSEQASLDRSARPLIDFNVFRKCGSKVSVNLQLPIQYLKLFLFQILAISMETQYGF